MADRSADVLKSVRPIAIVHVVCGLISVAIGVYTSWNQDASVVTKLKPNGLPLWGGILFILTGAIGILSTRGPKKSLIYGYMLLCATCVVVAVIMNRVLMPLLLDGGQDIPWNLCMGSYLALVAVIIIISLKGIYLTLKATVMYNNCCQKAPPRQRHRYPSVELSSSVCIRPEGSGEQVTNEQRQTRRASSSRSATSPPMPSGHRSHRHSRPPGARPHSSQSRRERERALRHSLSHSSSQATPVRVDHRPPPPEYQTMGLPHLPAYHEVVRSPPPPPYTEKEEDT